MTSIRQQKYSFSVPLCLFSEDRKKVQIMLVKSRRSADNCWPSLFVDQYKADPLTFDDMEKKMTLERFQKEVSSKMMMDHYKVLSLSNLLFITSTSLRTF